MALPQVLPVPAREIWIRQFRAAWDCAPARTHEEREQIVEQALTPIRPGLVGGQVGPSPSQAFEAGESLYPDVPWMSGLVSLFWASPYFPYLVATIGSCIALHEDETLRPMWIGFFRILHLLGVPRVPDLSADQYATPLTWGDAQHLLLQRAWHKWVESKDDDQSMLLGVQAYLALSRLPSPETMNEDLVSLRNFATSMIISEMYELHHEWGEPPQEPTAQDDSERATAKRRE